MEQGKQGVVVKLPPHQNPVEQIQARFKELENGFRTWLAKQSLPVEAAVVTVTSAAQGAAIGGFMGTLTNDVSSSLPTPQAGLNPQAMASFKQAQVRICSFSYSFNKHYFMEFRVPNSSALFFSKSLLLSF